MACLAFFVGLIYTNWTVST